MNRIPTPISDALIAEFFREWPQFTQVENVSDLTLTCVAGLRQQFLTKLLRSGLLDPNQWLQVSRELELTQKLRYEIEQRQFSHC